MRIEIFNIILTRKSVNQNGTTSGRTGAPNGAENNSAHDGGLEAKGIDGIIGRDGNTEIMIVKKPILP